MATKVCKCGKSFPIQPHGTSERIEFTCNDCKSESQHPGGGQPPASPRRRPDNLRRKA